MITEKEFQDIAQNHLKVRSDGSTYIDDPALAKQYEEFLDAQNAASRGGQGSPTGLASSNPTCPQPINEADNCGCPNANCDNGNCHNPNCLDGNCTNPSDSGCLPPKPPTTPYKSCGYDIELLISDKGLLSTLQQLFALQAFPNQIVIENETAINISSPTDLKIINDDPNVDVQLTIPISVGSISASTPPAESVTAQFQFRQNVTNTLSFVLFKLNFDPSSSLPSRFDMGKIINEINLDLEAISATIVNQLLSPPKLSDYGALLSAFQQLFDSKMLSVANGVPGTLTTITISKPTNVKIINTCYPYFDAGVTIPFVFSGGGRGGPVSGNLTGCFRFTQNADHTLSLVLIDIQGLPSTASLSDKNAITSSINSTLAGVSSARLIQLLSPPTQGFSLASEFRMKKFAAEGNSPAAFGFYLMLNLNRAFPHPGSEVGNPPARIGDVDKAINFLNLPSNFAIGCPSGLFMDALINFFNRSNDWQTNCWDYAAGQWQSAGGDAPQTIVGFTISVDDNSNSIGVVLNLHFSASGLGGSATYFATIKMNLQGQGSLLMSFTSHANGSGFIGDLGEEKVQASVDFLIAGMLDNANTFINKCVLGNPIKVSPFSTLPELRHLQSYQFLLANTYQSCLLAGDGLSILGTLGFTRVSVPQFTNWRIIFCSTNDDKDGDTKIIVEVRSKGLGIASYNGGGAPDGGNCGFANDGSTHQCQLGDITPLGLADLSNADLKIYIFPYGNDEWAFNYELRADFVGDSGVVTTYSQSGSMDLNAISTNVVPLTNFKPLPSPPQHNAVCCPPSHNSGCSQP